jgi:release factor glutamine methyltransferase
MAAPSRPPRWTVGHLAAEGRRLLGEAKIPAAGLEARVLLRRSLDLTELEILAYPERTFPAASARRFLRRIERRVAGEPFAYILGEKEFWSLPLEVGPGVLIPRPETETLVQAVLDESGAGSILVADVGTGSGAVALALASELRDARILAVDSSPAALRIARRNAARLGLDNVEILRGDLYRALRGRGLESRLDVLASNPPYVRASDWAGLQPEVRDHEPRAALVPGPTGLEIIARLVAGAPEWLKPGGRIFLEIGRGQARAVRSLFRMGWSAVETRRDLAGILRVLSARWDGGNSKP